MLEHLMLRTFTTAMPPMNAAIQTTPTAASILLKGQTLASILAMKAAPPSPAQRSRHQAFASPEVPPRLTRHLAQIENLIAFSHDIREWGINE
jgi:hypothetical protein